MISVSYKEAYGEALPRNDEMILRYKNHLTKLEGYVSKMDPVPDFPKKHEWFNTKDGNGLSFD